MSFQSTSVIPFFVGASGVYKTSVALIAQSAFGKDLTTPLNLKDSPKKVKKIVYQASDKLLVMDDFSIDFLTKKERKIVDEFFFRLDDDYYAALGGDCINVLLMMTAETIPELDRNLKENCLFCLIKKGDIDPNDLSEYQRKASDGVYSKVVMGYIKWILETYENMNKENILLSLFDTFFELSSAELGDKYRHSVSYNVADLMVGTYLFLNYCENIGVISEKKSDEIFELQWKSIISLARAEKEMGYS